MRRRQYSLTQNPPTPYPLTHRLLVGLACLGFSLAGAGTAQGSIVFGIGTINASENVLFPGNQQGFVISGVASLSGDDILFTQPEAAELLKTSASGQASVVSVDGNGFTSFRTQLATGNLFEKFEVNTEFAAAGITYVARADDGTTTQFVTGPGQNRIHAYGTNGTLIQSIDIVAPTNAITAIRQVRIEGSLQPAAVPETSSWILLGGVLGLGLVVHARRRSRETWFPAMVRG